MSLPVAAIPCPCPYASHAGGGSFIRQSRHSRRKESSDQVCYFLASSMPGSSRIGQSQWRLPHTSGRSDPVQYPTTTSTSNSSADSCVLSLRIFDRLPTVLIKFPLPPSGDIHTQDLGFLDYAVKRVDDTTIRNHVQVPTASDWIRQRHCCGA